MSCIGSQVSGHGGIMKIIIVNDVVDNAKSMTEGMRRYLKNVTNNGPPHDYYDLIDIIEKLIDEIYKLREDI